MKTIIYSITVLQILLLTSCANSVRKQSDSIVVKTASEKSQYEWAAPIKLKGVPNLHKVSNTLYRSAQPTAEGMKNLQKMGIKTVVNLRSFHSDRDELKGTDLQYEHIHMKAWHPEEEDIIKFLKIVSDPNKTPVLVHCQHGADRTGTMCAVYRMVIQDWNADDALQEMKEGGFNFHSVWINLDPWIRKLNIKEIRKEITESKIKRTY